MALAENYVSKLSINETYRLLLGYVSSHPILKIKSTKEPHLIEAKSKSYWKRTKSGPSWKGSPDFFNVNIRLNKEDEKTRLEIDFDFSRSYMEIFCAAIILIGLSLLLGVIIERGVAIVGVVSTIAFAAFYAYLTPPHANDTREKIISEISSQLNDAEDKFSA